MKIKNLKKGSALLQVLVVSVIIATIAVFLLRLSISRSSTVARGTDVMIGRSAVQDCQDQINTALACFNVPADAVTGKDVFDVCGDPANASNPIQKRMNDLITAQFVTAPPNVTINCPSTLGNGKCLDTYYQCTPASLPGGYPVIARVCRDKNGGVDAAGNRICRFQYAVQNPTGLQGTWATM